MPGRSSSLHPAAAEGFASNADDYELSRPGYPQAAVDHLIGALGIGPGATIADVAAGTGKLTRLLVPTGARVVAVEPVDAMRHLLMETTPGALVVDATAERLPLKSEALDGVTVAQAFHWFDGPVALAEMARVMRPGGALAVVYNLRDRSASWLAEIDRVVDAHRHGAPQQTDGRWRDAFVHQEHFGPLEDAEFDNPQTFTPGELVARMRSLSYVGALDAAEQGAVLAEIALVLDSHPDTAGRTELVMAQVAVVSVCRRR